MRNHILSVLAITMAFYACKKKEKVELNNLKLNESIDAIVGYEDAKDIGTDNIEYPFALLLEAEDSTKFTFEGIDIKDKIIFQIPAKIDNSAAQQEGGGHFEIQDFTNKAELDKILKKYHAENHIYGFRLAIKDKEVQNKIKEALIKKYGAGIKNPNTDNGLYWNLKNEHRYVFFAPDYNRLIVLNNTNLSKTCYWDFMNGNIDFGNCDKVAYFKDLGLK